MGPSGSGTEVDGDTEALGKSPNGSPLDRSEVIAGWCGLGRGAGMGEGIEAFQLLVDGLGELERVKTVAERDELGDLLTRSASGQAWTRSRGVCGRS